jgi:hypothetical protein
MYRRRKLGAGTKKDGFKASGRDVNSGMLGHEK